LVTKLIEKKIKNVIDDLRIYLQNDGGDMKYINYINKILKIKISGACVGCHRFSETFDG
jgi:Fe-S cluster biogenesis protein NfuA